jgi:hypothetical protein
MTAPELLVARLGAEVGATSCTKGEAVTAFGETHLCRKTQIANLRRGCRPSAVWLGLQLGSWRHRLDDKVCYWLARAVNHDYDVRAQTSHMSPR